MTLLKIVVFTVLEDVVIFHVLFEVRKPVGDCNKLGPSNVKRHLAMEIYHAFIYKSMNECRTGVIYIWAKLVNLYRLLARILDESELLCVR